MFHLDAKLLSFSPFTPFFLFLLCHTACQKSSQNPSFYSESVETLILLCETSGKMLTTQLQVQNLENLYLETALGQWRSIILIMPLDSFHEVIVLQQSIMTLFLFLLQYLALRSRFNYRAKSSNIKQANASYAESKIPSPFPKQWPTCICFGWRKSYLLTGHTQSVNHPARLRFQNSPIRCWDTRALRLPSCLLSDMPPPCRSSYYQHLPYTDRQEEQIEVLNTEEAVILITPLNA